MFYTDTTTRNFNNIGALYGRLLDKKIEQYFNDSTHRHKMTNIPYWNENLLSALSKTITLYYQLRH